MKTASRSRRAAFQVIGQNSVKQAWDGSLIALNPGDSANMPQTLNGSMVFAYMNTSNVNSVGQLALISGNSAPTFLTALALLNQPSVLVNNWRGQNLNATNISVPGSNNPIEIAAYGPGMPGQNCVALPSDDVPVALAPMLCAQGNALPGYMQLILQGTSGDLAIFALIGGPMDSTGNNAYMISVNDAVNGNTGPGTGKTPPPGYYATTSGFVYTYQFNWGVSEVYVANMSPTTSPAAQVALRQL
jgi:hypothetical protein